VGESEKTWIEFEVTGLSSSGFRAEGESGAASWVSFDIRQPSYPLRSAPIYLVCGRGEAPQGDQHNEQTPKRRQLPENIAGTLVIRAGPVDGAKALGSALGTLSYNAAWTVGKHSEPEGYSVSLHLRNQDCERIQQLAFTGRIPSLVTIYTPDIEYDYHGDHRILNWNINEDFHEQSHGQFGDAKIFDVHFAYPSYPLSVFAENNAGEFVIREREERSAQISQAILDLTNIVISVKFALRRIEGQFTVIIGLIILAFIVWYCEQ
jgi:hypothetical protein